MPLTDTTCRNLKPKDKIYRKADSGGLYLEISPSGGRYWRFKYRFMGKENRLSLGVYPSVSLAKAREKRDEAKKQLATGQNPSQIKKDQKRLAILNAETTFESVAIEWHEARQEKWTTTHAQNIIHRLRTDIFSQIGHRPIADISAPELLAAIRKIEARGAFDIAHRALQNCGPVFRYAIATGRCEKNPAADLVGALKQTKHGHFAAIDADELPTFLKALENNDARLYPLTRFAIRLIMLTFVRTNELIGAKWSEFNFDAKEWLIPADRMKMRRAHLVPLSQQAIIILQELMRFRGPSAWVFPNIAHPQKHMSNNTILRAIDRLGYKGRMTGHGFRSLAMSALKEKLGYRHEVVDRQLAHAPQNKLDAAYDRAQFLPVRRKMMQNWADYLDNCTIMTHDNVIAASFGKGQSR